MGRNAQVRVSVVKTGNKSTTPGGSKLPHSLKIFHHPFIPHSENHFDSHLKLFLESDVIYTMGEIGTSVYFIASGSWRFIRRAVKKFVTSLTEITWRNDAGFRCGSSLHEGCRPRNYGVLQVSCQKLFEFIFIKDESLDC